MSLAAGLAAGIAALDVEVPAPGATSPSLLEFDLRRR